jgi:hypothetical protein
MFHLCRIKGYYYFRIKVPADVVPILKLKEIKKTLHTKVLKDAKVISKSYSFKLERIFTLTRSGMLTDKQIAGLLNEFKHKTLRDLENDRIQGEGLMTSKEIEDPEEGYGAYYEGCDTARDIFREALLTNDLKGIEPSVDDLLAAQSISPDKSSTQYKKVCREMLKVWIAIYGIEMERTTGNYNNDCDKQLKYRLLHQPITSQTETLTPSSPKVKQTISKERTISSLMESFIKEKLGSGEWSSNKTENDYRLSFKLFLYTLGDRNINSYVRDDAVHLRDIIRILPLRFFEKKEYKGKSLSQVVSMLHKNPAKTTMVIKTVNKHMIDISSFFT